jgi:hypothetical protein
MGLTVSEVARLIGHKDARLLLRYAHLSAKELAKKLDA